MRSRSAGFAAALTLAVCLAGTHEAAGQQANGVAILERAAERYQRVDALCASFVQRLEVPLLGSERTGRGRLCQASPDRFAMRFSEPMGDLVVVDGQWVWLYYPSLDDKQVIRLRVSGASGGYDLHREFLERPGEKYAVTYEAEEALDGRAMHRLRLVPRTPASYRAAVLWIETGTPVLRRIRIEEENGTVRTVTLSDVDLSPSVDASYFTFTPPPGAQVISR